MPVTLQSDRPHLTVSECARTKPAPETGDQTPESMMGSLFHATDRGSARYSRSQACRRRDWPSNRPEDSRAKQRERLLTMHVRDAWRSSVVALWLAGALASCSEPQCPAGYRKEHETCYRLTDAGTGAQTGEDEEELGDAESDAEPDDVEGLNEDGQSVSDGGATSLEAATSQAPSEAGAPPRAGARAARTKCVGTKPEARSESADPPTRCARENAGT
jgi:hypothetical protein